MAEADLELQLKVWKDLAISKQVLMRAATDALKLDPNCSQEELKAALDNAIKRYIEADISVSKAQEQAKVAVSTMEKKLADSEKARNIAEAARAETQAKLEKFEQQMVAERAQHAAEVKKLKDAVAEKERAIKAINTALADTPENVVKKLKALKKEKMDEADARKEVAAANAALRKEKQALEQQVKNMQAAQDNAAKLAEKYRELYTLCSDLHAQLKSLVEDAKSLPELPALEVAALEGIEKAGAEEEKKAGKGNR
ncbi:hypothetical protein [Sulfurivermis fontis]|uniref:hypothetical protein n=1 Tax=Sulfurivermis fontis TaxID=1972068 RepID=UPI000FDA2DB3|nr:hypothetical protein [Sulfurivermis fontis]